MGTLPYILQILFNICEISIDLYGSNPFSVLQNIPVCKYTIYSVAENVGCFQLSWYLKQYLTQGVWGFFATPMACRILVPQLGIKPVSPALEAWSKPLGHQRSPNTCSYLYILGIIQESLSKTYIWE